MAKRSEQKFLGELEDKDLYLIENALDFLADGHKELKEDCEKLVLKLYRNFWEKE